MTVLSQVISKGMEASSRKEIMRVKYTYDTTLK
jgi:hypothetical protein